VTPVRRLAVLPFVSISPDPKDDYLADGLTEELITTLSKLGELRVIARTSVMQYRSTSKAPAQIGAELGVSSVVEGSVRKTGSRLRITAQLIDVGSQTHLWASTYERELDDLPAVQAGIAEQVAESLGIEPRGVETARFQTSPPVRPDSYLASLKGRTLLHAESPTSLEAAKGQFELAIFLDARNAAAHCGLAEVATLTLLFHPDASRSTWEETGRRSAVRAIELDPDLAEAHGFLGLIHWISFDYVGAEREFRLALSLNPSYSRGHDWYAELLEEEARGDEAVLHHNLAEEADPLSVHTIEFSGLLLIRLGRLEEAYLRIERLRELQPTGPAYHYVLAHYYLAQSDLERCLQEVDQCEELVGDPRWKALDRAWHYALSGEKERSRTLLRLEEALPDLPPSAWVVADLYAELGDLEECFRWLDKAFQHRILPVSQFRLNPRRAEVRNDPRFQTLLKKMNLA
jgi:adenylate cyclase